MKKKLAGLISVILVMAFIITGCAFWTESNSQAGNSGSTSLGTAAEAATGITNSDAAVAATILNSSEIVVDTEFTAKDLEIGYDESTATKITLDGSSMEVSGNGAAAEGNVLTISQEGTYVINGTLTDGQIVIDADDNAKIRLVLNGVSINCSDHAPIYIKNADKVFITLEENTVNTLTDAATYVQQDDNTVDGIIFSKADLTINGDGSLNITANYKHGIVSKDELVITGGTFHITAADDAISGKDCVKIKDGSFTLSSSDGDGIKSKNDEDVTAGYIYIYGGSITVTDSREGIEGTAIVIEGGVIDITASDDGFNAASPSSDMGRGQMNPGGFDDGGTMENDTNCYISISGGSITINAAGDGIDSNGSIYISGGTIYVSGPTDSMNAGMDYNGTAEVTGGTIIIAGSVGMAQGFSDTSTQYSILYNLSSISVGGTEITLTDAEGNIVESFTPDKQYQSVIISTPDLRNGQTYTLTCNDQTADITISSIVTSGGEAGTPGFGGGMGGMGGMARPGR